MAAHVNIGSQFYAKIFLHFLCFGLSSSSTEYALGGGKVCSLVAEADRTFKLDAREESAIIITEDHFFSQLSGRFDFDCNFYVTRRSKREDGGIYVVIQNLNLRKDEVTGECIDFVQIGEFRKPDFLGFIFKKPKDSKRFCGKISSVKSVQENSSEEDEDIASNSFVLSEGTIYVKIHVEARRRIPPQESLGFRIAFTAFSTDCNKRPIDSFECRSRECIWARWVGDGVQNCPYKSCLDENGCQTLKSPMDVQTKYSSGTGTKVTIGAIVGIVLTFFLFLTCLWMAKNSRRLCWSPAGSRRNARIEMNHANVDRSEIGSGDFSSINQHPTAPPEPDVKDLPPSYESLFPPR